MKDDEKAFFRTCLKFISIQGVPYHDYKTAIPKTIIKTISEFMNYKRCQYLLKKWSDKGFYKYKLSLEFGWFVPEHFTGEYQEMYLEMLRKEGVNI